MKQAIAILLKEDKNIEKIRKKYVPNYKKFKPHITLVYDFKINNQKQLNEHIKNSIKGIKQFKLSLESLKKSTKGYYLYLLVKKGKKEIIKLYKKLNSRILKGFKNKDMPKFVPHITIGLFETKKEINRAIKEIKKENIKFKTKINYIDLLNLDKNDKIKSIKRFKL